MKSFNNIKSLTGKILVLLVVLNTVTGTQLSGQMIEIKSWKGTYPEMNNSYPLYFISFKGILFPEPNIFARYWPTHYYVEIESVPVTDESGMGIDASTGMMRITQKVLERYQMEGRYNETEGIKLNTSLSKEIAQKIFDSRKEKLSDHFQLSAGFITLYDRLDRLGKEVQNYEVRKIFEREADDLLVRFLMVNNLETGQGEKMDSFSEISAEQNKLMGEIDYTIEKVRFLSRIHPENARTSYSFLTR